MVLASNSPRRKQLLTLGELAFKVIPAQVDESPEPGEQAKAYVLRLAKLKAQTVAANAHVQDIVIAADTTVSLDGEVLGKPGDEVEAEIMLRRLRGKTHQVYTALAILRTQDGTMVTDMCKSDVPMRDYSDDEMRTYIRTGDPLDKAGAYAIQHDGFRPVESLSSCYANIMGLPLCHLTRSLERLDIQPGSDVPHACQRALAYDCPVYQQVLSGEL